jgi:hypothetical protein
MLFSLTGSRLPSLALFPCPVYLCPGRLHSQAPLFPSPTGVQPVQLYLRPKPEWDSLPPRHLSSAMLSEMGGSAIWGSVIVRVLGFGPKASRVPASHIRFHDRG